MSQTQVQEPKKNRWQAEDELRTPQQVAQFIAKGGKLSRKAKKFLANKGLLH
jgi:hypothetical protein